MKKWVCSALVGICLCKGAVAQQVVTATEQCLKNKQEVFRSMAKGTVASPNEEQYDIQHVKFDIELTNLSTAVGGSITTTSKVVVPFLTNFTFELTDVLIVDSVKINGQIRPFTDSGIVRVAHLSTPLLLNSIFTAQVFYHGIAKLGTAFATQGLNNDSTWRTQVTFTLSEPYTAREWWPCKQSLQDKIDSADIWITIPQGLKAGSNGLLKNITPMPNGKQRYEWKTNYPTAYYLFSASVAPYTEYSYYTQVPGTTDSVLIQNYIYQDPEFLKKNKAAIDSVGIMLQFMSELFGPYPFYKEKYGHCIAPFFGGMEHQTMTTQIDFGTSLTVHELGHQWFGDNVTCATWKDIWLNEGFASYIEYLFMERYRPAQVAYDHMQRFHERVLTHETPSGSIYVDDTTSDGRIFDGRLSYSKAAAIVHTLRFVINDDDKFFGLLRDYQDLYRGGNATTLQFQTLAEAKLGMDLDVFFKQWIYGEGYPVYYAEWNQVYDKVFIRINQQGSVPESVNIYNTPIEVKIIYEGGDTTMRLTQDEASEDYDLLWDKPIKNIIIDPQNWLLNDTRSVRRNPGLRLNEVSSNSIVVFPNPSFENWQIIGLNTSYQLLLTDVTGRVLWTAANGVLTGITIPATQLASGMYFLQILNGDNRVESFKLIKQ